MFWKQSGGHRHDRIHFWFTYRSAHRSGNCGADNPVRQTLTTTAAHVVSISIPYPFLALPGAAGILGRVLNERQTLP